jgi:pyruvate/2-oxoglutarate dehydrogenase complex dihydrolipoamide dehydrogenase (E3) component
MIADNIDVLVIGAGPAGLSAARILRERGIDRVVVVDREAEPGGIPRFCPHPTFGLTDYFRPMSGLSYASHLASGLDPKSISTQTTVTAISPELAVSLSRPDGEQQVAPKRILLATGIRETPRSARLVSGDRPLNVLTTGALQRMVAVSHHLPFQRPVIVGTELVSFSAVLTLRDCRVKPVAMLEGEDRIRTLKPADTLTRRLLDTPVLTGRRVVSINARPDNSSRLDSITVADLSGQTSTIACDAVIFTGRFVPEASLLAMLPHNFTDTGSLGPAIDQSWRLADPRLYAAGNVLRSVETAAWSAREGAAAANAIADDLQGRHDGAERRVPIICRDPVRLVTPSAIAVPGPRLGPLHLMLRMTRSATGRLTLSVDDRAIWRSSHFTAHPERRLRLSRNLPDLGSAGQITVGFDEARG